MADDYSSETVAGSVGRGVMAAKLGKAYADQLAPILEEHVAIVSKEMIGRTRHLVALARGLAGRPKGAGSSRDDYHGFETYSRYLPHREKPVADSSDVVMIGRRYFGIEPDVDAIASDARRNVQLIHKNYTLRNVRKLALIIVVRGGRDGLQLEGFRIDKVRLAGQSLEGSASFWFQNGDRFELGSSLIFNRKDVGRADWFAQYPTTFRDISLKGERHAEQSEAWMAHVFGRGETQDDYERRAFECRLEEDLPQFTEEGSPRIPVEEAKTFVKELRVRRKSVHAAIAKILRARAKEGLVMTRATAQELHKIYEAISDTPKVGDVSEAVRAGYLSALARADQMLTDSSTFEDADSLVDDMTVDPGAFLASKFMDDLWLGKNAEVLILQSPLVWNEARPVAKKLLRDLVLIGLMTELSIDYMVKHFLAGLGARSGEFWPYSRRLEEKRLSKALDGFEAAVAKTVWPLFRDAFKAIAANPDLIEDALVDDVVRRFEARDSPPDRVAIVAAARNVAVSEAELIGKIGAASGLVDATRQLRSAGMDGGRLKDFFSSCSDASEVGAKILRERVVYEHGSALFYRLVKIEG